MTSKKVEVVKVKELTIMARIKAKFEMGEMGHINSFFIKEVDKLRSDIKDIQWDIDTLTREYEKKSKDLESLALTAFETLEAAAENITNEDVKTEAAKKAFAPKYWKGVESAEAEVKAVEVRVDELTKNYNAEKEKMQTEIALLQSRVDLIYGKDAIEE